jgi:hypothetical protein
MHTVALLQRAGQWREVAQFSLGSVLGGTGDAIGLDVGVDLVLVDAEQALREAALDYHRSPTRGKISVTPTKPLSNQRDLSLAYSPGRGLCLPGDRGGPDAGAEYTSRGNLVGVVTNGTAVLGLGDIGPLAGKPVMEGKGCLFKKFAGIDVFDIELAERDPDKLVDIIAALEPTLGGINLEDIKAPECFYIEKKLRERHEHPGVPRRPARHRHHLAPRCSTGWSWWARTSARSRWRCRAPARRPSPAWT